MVVSHLHSDHFGWFERNGEITFKNALTCAHFKRPLDWMFPARMERGRAQTRVAFVRGVGCPSPLSVGVVRERRAE